MFGVPWRGGHRCRSPEDLQRETSGRTTPTAGRSRRSPVPPLVPACADPPQPTSGLRLPKTSPEVILPSSIFFTPPAKSSQASARPASMAVLRPGHADDLRAGGRIRRPRSPDRSGPTCRCQLRSILSGRRRRASADRVPEKLSWHLRRHWRTSAGPPQVRRTVRRAGIAFQLEVGCNYHPYAAPCACPGFTRVGGGGRERSRASRAPAGSERTDRGPADPSRGSHD